MKNNDFLMTVVAGLVLCTVCSDVSAESTCAPSASQGTCGSTSSTPQQRSCYSTYSNGTPLNQTDCKASYFPSNDPIYHCMAYYQCQWQPDATGVFHCQNENGAHQYVPCNPPS